jgi:putative redox protein
VRVFRKDRAGTTDAAAVSCGEAEEMALSATAHSIPGTSRQDVLIDGRHHLVTDEPEALGGTDCGPAPHELLPAALASCISLTLETYAQTKGWDVGEVTVDVVYDNKSSPRRFDISVGVGDVDETQLARLETVAAACPLRRALAAGFEFKERVQRRAERREEVTSHDERSA